MLFNLCFSARAVLAHLSVGFPSRNSLSDAASAQKSGIPIYLPALFELFVLKLHPIVSRHASASSLCLVDHMFVNPVTGKHS